jgi:hypothetical protein
MQSKKKKKKKKRKKKKTKKKKKKRKKKSRKTDFTVFDETQLDLVSIARSDPAESERSVKGKDDPEPVADSTSMELSSDCPSRFEHPLEVNGWKTCRPCEV